MIKGYKICTKLQGVTPEMLRNWNAEIKGDILLVKRQVMIRCPRSGELMQEKYCINCSHNFGRSSEKWIYCLPETEKVQGKR